MTMSSNTDGKVSIETRERLLSALGSPPGVVVARRIVDVVDHIEVILPAAGSIAADSRPSEFQGFAVSYRVGSVASAGRW
jgi:hypothetical protein